MIQKCSAWKNRKAWSYGCQAFCDKITPTQKSQKILCSLILIHILCKSMQEAYSKKMINANQLPDDKF